MAFTNEVPTFAGGKSLPADVIAEVRGDWSNDALTKSDGLPARSTVSFPLEDFDTAKSNRGFDVLSIARDACKTALGAEDYAAKCATFRIGTKTEVSDPVKAVKADAAKGIEASPAIPAMLTVHTYWKPRS